MISVNYLFNFKCFFLFILCIYKKYNFGVQVMFFTLTTTLPVQLITLPTALPVQCHIIPHYLYICNDVYNTIFHSQIFVNNVQYDFSQLFI